MAKKKPRAAAPARPASDADIPVVGPREPCPCGSGRRYKACHGRAERAPFVARPFEGLAGECDWVALREIVPAATAPLTLSGPRADERATLATVLPLAWPGLRRDDGAVLVGLQTAAGSGDPSRDVAAALLAAIDAEPGTPVSPVDVPAGAPRLQDVLDPAARLDVTVHSGFEFWLESGSEAAESPDVVASLERANEAAVPTERLTTVEAAYWCRIGDRAHLRWVLPYEEADLLDALARLKGAGAEEVGEGSRYIGSFRAHGLLVPVWDLAPGTSAEQVEEPAAEFLARLQEAMADSSPLDEEARRARNGLLSRQITLR